MARTRSLLVALCGMALLLNAHAEASFLTYEIDPGNPTFILEWDSNGTIGDSSTTFYAGAPSYTDATYWNIASSANKLIIFSYSESDKELTFGPSSITMSFKTNDVTYTVPIDKVFVIIYNVYNDYFTSGSLYFQGGDNQLWLNSHESYSVLFTNNSSYLSDHCLIGYISVSSVQLDVTLNPPAVPLPGAVWLLGTGLAGLALALRRRQRRS
jgi:hypothetical protein